MTRNHYELKTMTMRAVPWILAMIIASVFVSDTALAGPTKTRFDSKNDVFSRIFKKSRVKDHGAFQHVLEVMSGSGLPWQDHARAFTLPRIEGIVVVTHVDADKDSGGSFGENSGPNQIDLVQREESHGDDSDEFELTTGHTVQENPIAIDDQ